MRSLGTEAHRFLTELIKKDAKFLRDNKLMDYSLLLIIAQFPKEVRDNKKRNLYMNTSGEYYYSFGIIDFLMNYSKWKGLENMFIRRILLKNQNDISTVEPNFYGTRFQGSMEKVFHGKTKLD
jgi:hypothetical protein